MEPFRDPFFSGRRRISNRNYGANRVGREELAQFDEGFGQGFGGGGILGRGDLGDPFARMDQMMGQMGSMGQEMLVGGNGGHNGGFYSSSSSVSFSSSGGKTQRYKSTTNTSNIGGRRVTESKSAYTNSDGLDKMAWGRSLDGGSNLRGHLVTKQHHRGMETGPVMNETFREWDSAAHQSRLGIGRSTHHARLGGRHRGGAQPRQQRQLATAHTSAPSQDSYAPSSGRPSLQEDYRNLDRID